ncbi:Choline-transporter-like protein [Blattamonas nauphoetae]|uniref:Choline-transporter-like protein n=1 Tax=Blattamonas nauphoetae TaxID=2049346 RepID=A0ABQ9YJV6_9EUKA|nr:Choline-transporter-like protein [Blattamonas nauphoetae]
MNSEDPSGDGVPTLPMEPETPPTTFVKLVSQPVNDNEFNLTRRKGLCTDLYCLIFLVLFIVIFVIAFVFSLIIGNPTTYLAPSNGDGNQCGIYQNSSAKVDLRPTPELFVVPDSSETTLCVSSCPSTGEYCLLPEGHFSKISKQSCIDLNVTESSLQGGYFYYLNVTQDMGTFIHHCVTSFSNLDKQVPAYEEYTDILTMSVNDLGNSWLVILLSIAVSVVLGIIFVAILLCEARCSIWTVVILSLALILIAGVLFIFCAIRIISSPLILDQPNCTFFFVVGALCLCVFIIGLLLSICNSKSITRNAVLLREGKRHIANHLSAVVTPFIILVIWIAISALFIVATIFFLSVRVNPFTKTLESKTGFTLFRMIPFILLALYVWFSATMLSCNHMIISSLVGLSFYDSDPDNLMKPKKDNRFCLILRHIALKQLGSAALGSIVVFFTKPFRFCCSWSTFRLIRKTRQFEVEDQAWIERQAQNTKNGDGAPNSVHISSFDEESGNDQQPLESMNNPSTITPQPDPPSQFDPPLFPRDNSRSEEAEHADLGEQTETDKVNQNPQPKHDDNIALSSLPDERPSRCCVGCVPCCLSFCTSCQSCCGGNSSVAFTLSAFTRSSFPSSSSLLSSLLRRPWNTSLQHALLFPSLFSFVFLLGSIAVALVTTLACILIFLRPDLLGIGRSAYFLNLDIDVYQVWLVVLFVFFSSFYVARMAFSAWEVAGKAVFVCGMIEEEEERHRNANGTIPQADLRQSRTLEAGQPEGGLEAPEQETQMESFSEPQAVHPETKPPTPPQTVARSFITAAYSYALQTLRDEREVEEKAEVEKWKLGFAAEIDLMKKKKFDQMEREKRKEEERKLAEEKKREEEARKQEQQQKEEEERRRLEEQRLAQEQAPLESQGTSIQPDGPTVERGEPAQDHPIESEYELA